MQQLTTVRGYIEEANVFVLNDIIRRAASVNPAGPAIITDDSVITWSEFCDRVQRMAGALRSKGLQRADRVAIFSLNSARQYEFMFAAIWAGGIVVPMNTRLAEKELEYCLNDLDGPWACADDRFLHVTENLRDGITGLKGLFYLGQEDAPPGYTGFEELLAGDPGLIGDDPHTEDVALIYYTGGTTGVAKGVMLTHQQMKHSAQQIANGLKTSRPFDSDSVYAHVAPMFHMADGAMCIAVPMITGANTFIERFDIAALVEHCNKHRVSWLTLVPTMVKMLCDYLNANSADIPSLQGIMYGAAPMPLAVLKQVIATLPKVQLFQGYGSTEALIISMLEPRYHVLAEENMDLLRSAGIPFEGVLIGIFDPEGRQLPPGEVGEIYVRSNSVMKGYWNKPELTRQALAGNWFHTGDAGYLNERGFVFLVDRVKDMVISGGENIYPKEVENVLEGFRNIVECAVVGLPHEKWGEIVHAVVVVKAGATVTEKELDAHCRHQIAGYKVPKSYAISTTPLPRTVLGKIDKLTLRGKREGLYRD